MRVAGKVIARGPGRPFWPRLVLLALAVGVGACGSDDEETVKTGTPSSDAGVNADAGPKGTLDGAVADNPYEPVILAIGAAAQAAVADQTVPSVAIALVDDKSTIWEAGFGLADPATNRAATARTVYGIGSVTKVFTALATLMLAEKGTLALEDPVNQHLPAFKPRTRGPATPPPSVRSLISHHSGLPSDVIKGFFSTTPYQYKDYVGLVSETYTIAAPWTVLAYSNPAYAILGHIVAQKNGAEYGEVIAKSIFTPIGMNDSFYDSPSRPVDVAPGYLEGKPFDEGRIGPGPAGSLRASAHDLARFARMLLNRGVIDGVRVASQATVTSMWTAQNEKVALDFEQRIGLPLFLFRDGDFEGRLIAEHGGDTITFHALLALDPEARLAALALTNGAEGSEIVRTLAREGLKQALAVKLGRPLRGPTPTAAPAKRKPAAGELAELAGVYAAGPTLLDVEAADDALQITPVGTKNTLQFVPAEKGLFLLEGTDITLKIQPVNGVMTIAQSGRGGYGLAATRVPPTVVEPVWQVRAGTYALLDGGGDLARIDDLQLAVVDDRLILTYSDGESDHVNVLVPQNDTEAVVAGFGRGLGETLEAIDGAMPRLKFGGYTFQKMP